MLKIYRNTAIFIVLVMFGVQWGFYKPYTSQFPNFKNATTVIHIHGMLLMSWLILLIVQPILIQTGRRTLHRNIGKVSWVLGPLIILFLFLVGKGGYARSLNQVPIEMSYQFMVLDIRGLVSFAIFWALAMFYRKNSASHMRYMIATGILGIGPGIGRGLINTVGLEIGQALLITDVLGLVIVGTMLGYDLYRKKNFKPFLIVFLVLLIGSTLWQLRESAAWQSFAKVYASLFY